VVGRRLEAEVGPVAHGGHCVARVRVDDAATRVVFVRHALPGERVVLEITEGTEGDRFWRADATEVLEAAEDRVVAPCPVAGPGGCGGCDFQHVALPEQRRLKAAVVREQLVRLGGLAEDDPLLTALVVEAVRVPGREADDGLRWRTRTTFVAAPDGTTGLRKHRSHDVVPVADCLITAEEASTRLVGAPRETGTVVEHVRADGATLGLARAVDAFWQVHPAAPTVLVEAVLDLLDPRPGESVLDLYAGVGLFGAFLARRTGPGARVDLVEGDRDAAEHARRNLADRPEDRTSVTGGDVARVLASGDRDPTDLVVLDPPRAGARAAVVAEVAARGPRAVAYVACDPAALGRDVATFAEHGYRLAALRAYDLFPMTHHVECVALLLPR
jgi:tRNA/tmRNA/rRNA uracil-C5-methylase (TrmA/RlmC/RlmD family)